MTPEALQGDLGFFFPAELLQLLNLAQVTGRLELRRGAERVDLFIEGGQPVFARTTGMTVRTGEMLVHHKVISQEALDLMLAIQSDQPGHRIGELLADSGAVSREQVDAALRDILKRIVYGALLWQEGSFRFLPGERSGEDTKLDIELDRLILDGLRLADEARRRA
jgi:hypothetical protein